MNVFQLFSFTPKLRTSGSWQCQVYWDAENQILLKAAMSMLWICQQQKTHNFYIHSLQIKLSKKGKGNCTE